MSEWWKRPLRTEWRVWGRQLWCVVLCRSGWQWWHLECYQLPEKFGIQLNIQTRPPTMILPPCASYPSSCANPEAIPIFAIGAGIARAKWTAMASGTSPVRVAALETRPHSASHFGTKRTWLRLTDQTRK